MVPIWVIASCVFRKEMFILIHFITICSLVAIQRHWQLTTTTHQDHLLSSSICLETHFFWESMKVGMWIYQETDNTQPALPDKVKWKSPRTSFIVIRHNLPMTTSQRTKFLPSATVIKRGCWERLSVNVRFVGGVKWASAGSLSGSATHHGKLVCVPLLYTTVCHWTLLQLRSHPNRGIQN